MQQSKNDGVNVVAKGLARFNADGSLWLAPEAKEAVMALLVNTTDEVLEETFGLTETQSRICMELAWAESDVQAAAAVMDAHRVDHRAY